MHLHKTHGTVFQWYFVPWITDHLPSFIHIPKQKTIYDKIKVTFRNHSQNCVNSFLHELSTVNWQVAIHGTIDNQFQYFDHLVNSMYCKHFPLKTKYLTLQRLQKPWLTAGLLQSIKNKSLYFKLPRLGLMSQDFNKSYKNRLTAVLRAAKKTILCSFL
jgi:hypothetical protein